MFSSKIVVAIVIALCSSAVIVHRHCMTVWCKDFPSDSDDSILKRLEENDQILQNLSSTSEKINEKLDALFDFVNATLKRVNSHDSPSDSNDNIWKRLEENDQILQNLSSASEKINEKLDALFDLVNASRERVKSRDNCEDKPPVVYDCSDVRDIGYTKSGEYLLYVDHQNKRYYAYAYCDMTTEGRTWTVFQRREDGSEDFYRGWNDYRYGFGDTNGEFWMGNEFLHLLTTKRKYRLRIDLEDFEGNWRFAEYSTFSITSSEDKYRLIISGYSGNAGGESLSTHDGRKFTTKDTDNDMWSGGNDAEYYQSGWWHDGASLSNLNGLYLRGDYSENCPYEVCEDGIFWEQWHGSKYSLKTTEMKISSPDVSEKTSNVEVHILWA